jgi:ribosome-associated protein
MFQNLITQRQAWHNEPIMLQVSTKIIIPDEELQFTFSRSSGPGGQNVNKVNSKATLHWDFGTSTALPLDIRDRFQQNYGTRITNEGKIVITCQESRDQPKNIDICLTKLRDMILSVLHAPKKRRPTKPTKGSQTRRLNEKKLRSQTKQGRQGGSRNSDD